MTSNDGQLSAGHLSVMRMAELQTSEFNTPGQYDRWDLMECIQHILLTFMDEIADDECKKLAAIMMALAGTHPAFKLTYNAAEKGVEFVQVKRTKAGHRATDITNHIDLAVANGTKQESAVEDALVRFGVSRREIFRSIKMVRDYRAGMHEMGMSDGMELPEGYNVDSAGRLVPMD